MTMATDWKAVLGSLAGSMPQDTAPEAEEAAPEKCRAINPRRLRIDIERKGRAGKCATIVSGFDDLSDDEIARVAADLKRTLATGGSVRGGEILVQGNRRDDVLNFFETYKL